jgi:hypothetical protein
MSIGSFVFDTVDQRVEKLLHEDHAEKGLIDLYSDLALTLQSRAGTAAGVTGLSEYVFFQFIKRRLEETTGTPFIRERLGIPYIFRSKNILLTHDIDIAKFKIGCKKQKTDIAIFLIQADGQFQLLAGFEIKAYITCPGIITQLFANFDNLAERTNALLFSVLFDKGKIAEFEDFCSRHPSRAYVISKYDCICRITINEALDRIAAMLPAE